MTDGALSSFVEAVPMPSVLIGRDERILAANKHARALLGQNIVSRHFITALRQPTLLDAIEATLRDGEDRKSRYLTNDGAQDTTFRVSCRAVDRSEGRAALVCFDDITAEERAGQMRRDFVANVSHELRTPLTALLGFIETLRGPARDDPAARDRFLATMEGEAGRMNRLVGDLLSLNRVENDERMRPRTVLDVGPLLRSTLMGLKPLADEANVELVLDIPETSLNVLGDTDQLRQVFTNLIENAIKYSGEGTRVTARASGPAFESRLRVDGVRIEVVDTGPGIDPVHIPRLAERFYRVDDHRSREKGGTGLGLAIVKHIINRHRGRLRITSEIGSGSNFTVILPIA